MKKLFAIAGFLLASTAAQAQYTFEYGGHTLRIDQDRGKVSIPGVYDNSGRKSKRTRGDQESDRPRKQAPEQAKIDPQAPATDPAPAAPAPAVQAPAPANTVSVPTAATATVAPTATTTSTEPPANPAPAANSAGRRTCRPARTASSGRDRTPVRAGAEARVPGPVGKLAARRLADGREGRQGPDRAMRQQSLRIFGGWEIRPERRAGLDRHEARQGQMERADFRPEIRQHL